MIARVLRNRFASFAPERLYSAVKPFIGLKDTIELYRIIGDYCPEGLKLWLKLPPIEAADKFIRTFENFYFPLWKMPKWYRAELKLEKLVGSMLIESHSLLSTRYEPDKKMPSGQFLAEVICACPFQSYEASRLPVVAEFKRRMGEELANPLIALLPEGGFSLAEIEGALADSPYPGLLARCRWVFGSTGNAFLDREPNTRAWTRDNVDRLSRDWTGFAAIDDAITDFDKWLDADDFNLRAAEVIHYIANERAKLLINIFGS